MIRRAVAAVFSIMSCLIAAQPAQAHPHVFIDNTVALVFDARMIVHQVGDKSS